MTIEEMIENEEAAVQRAFKFFKYDKPILYQKI